MKTGKVLLVDDNESLAAVIQSLLNSESMQVETCGTFAAARERAKDADVLILDLSLPDGRGEDLLEEIRSRGDMTPIIVISGYKDRLDRLADEDLVIKLPKPFGVDELNSAVHRGLKLSSSVYALQECNEKLDKWIERDKRRTR